jgi:UrcA family protein
MERGKMAMKRTTVILMAALALPLTAFGAAPSHFEDVSVKVSYADLNIDNEAGAKILYMRLRNAAEEVCGLGSDVKLGSRTASSHAKACYREALDKAVTEINHEQLSRIHES